MATKNKVVMTPRPICDPQELDASGLLPEDQER